MNIWDLATVVGVARIAIGLIVIGLLVMWTSRHHQPHPVRVHARNSHDRH